MSSVDMGPSRRFVEAIRAAARADMGHELPPGTTVVGSAGREGSDAAVAYPMGDSTLVWCAPRLVAHLASIDGGPALSNDAFVSVATALGGTDVSWGRFRVFEGTPSAF